MGDDSSCCSNDVDVDDDVSMAMDRSGARLFGDDGGGNDEDGLPNPSPLLPLLLFFPFFLSAKSTDDDDDEWSDGYKEVDAGLRRHRCCCNCDVEASDNADINGRRAAMKK